MATWFASAVDGSNANAGTSWALAKQTVAGALAVAGVGDTIKVDSAGTFTATAAITWTPPAGGIAIISVNRAGADAWLAGATETVGASSAAFTIAGAANSGMFVYGMTLNAGTNNSALCNISILTAASVNSYVEFKSATLQLNSVATTANIVIGASNTTASQGTRAKFDSCAFSVTSSRASTYVMCGQADIEIINPTFSVTGATKPAAVFGQQTVGSSIANVTVRDGDMSGYAVAGGSYVSLTNVTAAKFVFENLKLSATPTITSGSWTAGSGGSILLRNCDSANTIYTFQYINALGTLTQSTSIYNNAGASFNNAGISWQIATTANASEFTPFVTPQLEEWTTLTTAQTGTIDFIRDNATALTDRDIWSDQDYAASASLPNYTYASNRNANPFTGTAASQPTSTATWTGTGGFANPTKQKLQVAFTAAAVGLLQSRVYVSVASTTLYVDPIVTGIT